MIAAGAYLKALRTKTGLSQGKLAELIGVAGNTIWRIEAGKQEPGGGQLAALLTTLHGRVEDFQALIIDQKATAEDAERLAKQAQEARQQLLAFAENDDGRRRLLERIAQLTTDPALQARIEGYLDGLSIP